MNTCTCISEKAYEFCFSRKEILTSVKKELLLLQEDDQRLWFATWHQPDVSFETHWNSFKQKCTREHPIKERNWIWRLGKVTQTIEEKITKTFHSISLQN